MRISERQVWTINCRLPEATFYLRLLEVKLWWIGSRGSVIRKGVWGEVKGVRRAGEGAGRGQGSEVQEAGFLTLGGDAKIYVRT